MMKKIFAGASAILLILAFCFAMPPKALSWWDYYYPHFYYGYHHYHHGHGAFLSFAFPLSFGYYEPGYYARGYPGSVLVYKEAPTKNAFLRLNVQPGEAEIFLDGRYLGRADSLYDKSIPTRAGGHKLQLTVRGYSQYYRVNIPSGSTSYFTKNLPVH